MTTSCFTGVDVASLPDANKVSITQKIILASYVNGFLETSFVAVDTNLENKKREIYNMLRYVQCRGFWSVEFVFRDLFGKTVSSLVESSLVSPTRARLLHLLCRALA